MIVDVGIMEYWNGGTMLFFQSPHYSDKVLHTNKLENR